MTSALKKWILEAAEISIETGTSCEGTDGERAYAENFSVDSHPK